MYLFITFFNEGFSSKHFLKSVVENVAENSDIKIELNIV